MVQKKSERPCDNCAVLLDVRTGREFFAHGSLVRAANDEHLALRKYQCSVCRSELFHNSMSKYWYLAPPSD